MDSKMSLRISRQCARFPSCQDANDGFQSCECGDQRMKNGKCSGIDSSAESVPCRVASCASVLKSKHSESVHFSVYHKDLRRVLRRTGN